MVINRAEEQRDLNFNFGGDIKEEDTMEFWKLFITALMPNVKVLLITAAGTILALDRFGILGKDARNHVNNVSFIITFLFHFHSNYDIMILLLADI